MRLFLLLSMILLGTLFNAVAQSSQLDVAVLAVDWSPDGSNIATGDTTGEINIWDAVSGSLRGTFQGHTQEIMALKWSPDGNQLASGSPDGTVRIWDLMTGAPITVIEFARPDSSLRAILALAWSPDGLLIAGARETGQVDIWDAKTGNLQAEYSHDGMAFDVEWSSLGNILASSGLDGKVFLWSDTTQTLSEFSPISSSNQGPVDALAWSPDGSKIAIRSLRSGVQVFEFASQRQLFQISQPVSIGIALQWSPDGTNIAIGRLSGTVDIVDVSSGLVVDTISGSKTYNDLAWSPFGGRLALGHIENRPLLRLTDAIQIHVPAPSLRRLEAISEACNAPAIIQQVLPDSVGISQLSTFVGSVESLSESAISPACADDLVAVANALQGK